MVWGKQRVAGDCDVEWCDGLCWECVTEQRSRCRLLQTGSICLTLIQSFGRHSAESWISTYWSIRLFIEQLKWQSVWLNWVAHTCRGLIQFLLHANYSKIEGLTKCCWHNPSFNLLLALTVWKQKPYTWWHFKITARSSLFKRNRTFWNDQRQRKLLCCAKDLFFFDFSDEMWKNNVCFDFTNQNRETKKGTWRQMNEWVPY